ncbi:MAG: carbohydrate-binding family 9-like protein [Bacteroidetes bacterium]|nr:carbohydrate-binding family 9-like protein [Bacteroidota bacterium]MBU1116642.1 carbohydrate-binding family 9-like protein [Bacteroidota bacterium]MBU1797507.1 carbohydrate-binding family 9-like protein [Bacteroidota bacterium]
MVYKVKEADSFSNNGCEIGELNNFMGDFPTHFPKAKFKLSYNEKSLLLRFDLQDNFVIANSENHFDNVWEDSCVELFFTPSTNNEDGYFNLEINCCGKVYFQHQKSKRNQVKRMDINDIDKLNVKSSFSGSIKEEIVKPTNWFIECEIPFDILAKYSRIELPSIGVEWRANLYKCADASSHPHWLTWNKIDFPEPNFHLPEFFGELHFE